MSTIVPGVGKSYIIMKYFMSDARPIVILRSASLHAATALVLHRHTWSSIIINIVLQTPVKQFCYVSVQADIHRESYWIQIKQFLQILQVGGGRAWLMWSSCICIRLGWYQTWWLK
jgi:hypothetical protein